MSEIVAIIGSRDCPNMDGVREFVDLVKKRGDQIITGTHRGVEKAVEDHAIAIGIEVAVFVPNHAEFGMHAPLLRVCDIIDACDRLVVFRSGKSSRLTLAEKQAHRLGKPVHVRVDEVGE